MLRERLYEFRFLPYLAWATLREVNFTFHVNFFNMIFLFLDKDVDCIYTVFYYKKYWQKSL